jgi:ornithine carbamoyltransferase
MVRHFLSQDDFSAQETLEIFSRTAALKPVRRSSEMAGRSLVMFFEKSSTRTRLSFEIGISQLGGHAVYLDRESSQLSRGESIEDTARVVSRYADLMMARVFAHDTVVRLSAQSTIPVINGLSDDEHPCQSMADMFTIQEAFNGDRVKIAYVGDGNNNVTHSLMLAASRLGHPISIAAPPAFQPDAGFVERARRNAGSSGGSVSVTANPFEAVQGARVVYTDVWVSMGRESGKAERLQALRPFQVNEQLMKAAAPRAIFMHCLPAHVGEEVAAGVAYGPSSVIFDQAENRMHVQKAIMLFLLESM